MSRHDRCTAMYCRGHAYPTWLPQHSSLSRSAAELAVINHSGLMSIFSLTSQATASARLPSLHHVIGWVHGILS